MPLGLAVPEQIQRIHGVEAELEGRHGIYCAGADEVAAGRPAGGTAVELDHVAPAREASAGIEQHALAVLELVDGGIDVAGAGVDGDAAAGTGGVCRECGRREKGEEHGGGECGSKHIHPFAPARRYSAYMRTAPCSPPAGMAPVTAAPGITAVDTSM